MISIAIGGAVGGLLGFLGGLAYRKWARKVGRL